MKVATDPCLGNVAIVGAVQPLGSPPPPRRPSGRRRRGHRAAELAGRRLDVVRDEADVVRVNVRFGPAANPVRPGK